MKTSKGIVEKTNEWYDRRLLRTRKYSAKTLFISIIFLIISLFLAVSSFSWDRLLLIGAFSFSIFMSLHNKKVLKTKKEDVIFDTEYMEKDSEGDGYLEPDEEDTENEDSGEIQ